MGCACPFSDLDASHPLLFPPINLNFLKIQIGRGRTAAYSANLPFTEFCKKRQKKNRKGCHTFTVIRVSISIL
jgi:hypothetical protein